MGYTHYWTLNEPISPDVFALIAADARRLVAATAVPLGFDFDDCNPPSIGINAICFNGVDDDGHETFLFDRVETGFNFCKTARKPYDIVVCAVLAVAAQHAGGILEVTSDGDDSEPEWGRAIGWASEVLGRPVCCPAGVRGYAAPARFVAGGAL